jgi:small multidrug resistance pump
MKHLLMLLCAIICEVLATSSLKFSEGFTRVIPSVLVLMGYGISLYLLSLSIKGIPISVAYAIWSGLGIVLIAVIGVAFWHEHMDWVRGVGIFLIVIGVLVINLFSKVGAH